MTASFLFIQCSRSVSRVLCRHLHYTSNCNGFRHLSWPVITERLIRPTPRLGRATLRHRYTWPFNSWDVRLPVSPREPVSSYLTFSPLSRPCGRNGYFLLRYHTLADIFPLGSMKLCVVRTFLSAPYGSGTTKQPAAAQR